MSSLTKTIRILTAALAVLFGGFASTAMAQTTNCGVTGSTSTAPVVYDPFNPSGLASTTITVNLTRVNNSGGGDTRIVNFFLRANAATGSATDGATITPISVAGSAAITGIGLNIFYNYAAAAPGRRAVRRPRRARDRPLRAAARLRGGSADLCADLGCTDRSQPLPQDQLHRQQSSIGYGASDLSG